MEGLYPYPEKTPGSDSKEGNYVHNLSEANAAALKALRIWVIDFQIDLTELCSDYLDPTLILLRYLRANQFNSTKAIDHMTKNIEWRKEQNVSEIIKQTPEEILGVKMEDITSLFPHWHSGYDKTGRPVLYKQYGKFEATTLKKLLDGSYDKLVKYHIWEQEACCRLCLQQSHKLQKIVETASCIIDIKNMTIGQVTKDFLALIKLMAAVDQNQYPETLGRIFIVNAPSAFPFVWRMVKGFLDPAVAAKITVAASATEYEPLLNDAIGRENLPANYGGILPPLNIGVHPYAETMREYEGREGKEGQGIEGVAVVAGDGGQSMHPTRSRSRSQTSEKSFQGTNPQRAKLTQNHPATTTEGGIELVSNNKSITNGTSLPRPKSVNRRFSNNSYTAASVTSQSGATGFSYFTNLLLRPFALFAIADTNSSSNRNSGNYSFNSDNDGEDSDNSSDESDRSSTDTGDIEGGTSGRKNKQNRRNRNRNRNHDVDVESVKSNSSSHDSAFCDAFETQSEMDQSAHRDKSGMNVHFAESATVDHPKDEIGDKKSTFCGRIANSCLFNTLRVFIKMITPNLNSVSFESLCRYLNISVTIYFLCAATALVLSAFALNTTRWSSDISRAQLWAGILVLLISTLMIMFTFVGYLGIRTKSRPLLIMFGSGLTLGSLVFAISSIACFLYLYVPAVAGFGNAALHDTINLNNSQVRAQVRRYNMTIAIGSLIATVFGIVPLTLTLALIKRIKKEFGNLSNKTKIKNLQILLKIAQIISICFAVVMFCYGFSSVYQLLDIGYGQAIFDVFGLIFGGVTVIICSIVGWWSSKTVHKSVLRLYYIFCQPVLIIVLFLTAVLNFAEISQSDNDVAKVYSKLNTTVKENNVKIMIQTMLLVTGILCCFACVFQSISFVAARSLSMLIDTADNQDNEEAILKTMRQKELGILGLNNNHNNSNNIAGTDDLEAGLAGSTNNTTGGVAANNNNSSSNNIMDQLLSQFSIAHLGRMYMIHVRGIKDKLSIAYGILFGLFNIYVQGTFVIFASAMNDTTGGQTADLWEFTLWQGMGKIDRRFVSGDGFVVVSCAIMALVVGPLLLIYSWSTFVLAPSRHAYGIISSVIQIMAWIQFYSIEIHAKYQHMHSNNDASGGGGIALFVLLSFFMYFICPAIVLYREVNASVKDTSTSDSHELLLETNKADSNFLNNNSGHGTYAATPDAKTSTRFRRRSSTSASSLTGSTFSNSGYNPYSNASHSTYTQSQREMFSRFSIDETAVYSGAAAASTLRRDSGGDRNPPASPSPSPSPSPLIPLEGSSYRYGRVSHHRSPSPNPVEGYHGSPAEKQSRSHHNHRHSNSNSKRNDDSGACNDNSADDDDDEQDVDAENIVTRHYYSNSGGGKRSKPGSFTAADPSSHQGIAYRKLDFGEEKNPDFEPLTSYSIAAAEKVKRENEKKKAAALITDRDAKASVQRVPFRPHYNRSESRETEEKDDILHQNTVQNRYSMSNAAGSAFTMLKRNSYTTAAIATAKALSRENSMNFTQNAAKNNEILTANNRNYLLQQIGVNTAEAATVMVNLIRVKERKNKKHSLAMVI